MIVTVCCDGGARGNPGPAAAAFVMKDDAGNLREMRGKYLGTATNNVAEYMAVVEALGYLRNLSDLGHLNEVRFFLDSNLVVNQLKGLFKVKNASLRELLLSVRALEQKLPGVTITYQFVPREQNQEADKLVNETLDKVQ